MYFYRFKVSYYNQLEEKKASDKGFVFGESYAEAAGKLERWYGEDLLAIELLYEIDNDIVLLDENIDYIQREEKKK